VTYGPCGLGELEMDATLWFGGLGTSIMDLLVRVVDVNAEDINGSRFLPGDGIP
jgi:hypothetical protein